MHDVGFCKGSIFSSLKNYVYENFKIPFLIICLKHQIRKLRNIAQHENVKLFKIITRR